MEKLPQPFLLNKFLFESWKVDFDDVDTTAEEFVASNISEQEFMSRLTDAFNKTTKKKYGGMGLNAWKFDAILDLSFGVYRSYFNDNPIVKICFENESTRDITINNTFFQVFYSLGEFEYLGFLNPRIKQIILDKITPAEIYSLLRASTASKSMFFMQEFSSNDHQGFETIQDYLEGVIVDKDKWKAPADPEIKNILDKYMDERFTQLGSTVDRSINQGTAVIVKGIKNSLIPFILLRDLSFQVFREDTGFNLTGLSNEHMKINFETFTKLKEAWNSFEGLFIVSGSSSDQLMNIEQRFKITLINLCIGLKKYIEEVKQEFGNELMIVWLNKLLANLNSFLRMVKENKGSGFGFSIFPNESTLNRGLSSSVARASIKRFLDNDEVIQDLFPRKTKDLMNALKAYKIFFEFLRSLNYAGEQLYFDKRIEFPELLSTVIG